MIKLDPSVIPLQEIGTIEGNGEDPTLVEDRRRKKKKKKKKRRPY